MSTPTISPERLALGTGGATVGAVMRVSSSTYIICDADSSQAATAALVPYGVALQSGDAGDYVDIDISEIVSCRAGAAITAGQLLVAEDGGAGDVIPYDVSDYVDGSNVYTVGRAAESAAAGNYLLVQWDVTLNTLSIPG